MKAHFTVDVERDLHTNNSLGITEGIPKLLEILKRNKIQATFFIVGNVIRENSRLVKRIKKENHELGIHGHTHRRFDSLSFKQKENEIKLASKEFKKVLGEKPKLFRAPQHSIDKDTLSILKKHEIAYDSSVCSRNLMLLRHLAKKESNKKEILVNFFGKTRPYIDDGIKEIPRPAMLLALGGFELKVYPTPLIKSITKAHFLFNVPINFVMHSWDMIDIKQSRTSKYCTAEEFHKKLDSLIKDIKLKYRFTPISYA